MILQVATTGGKDLPIIGELAAFFLQREIELLKEIDGNREEDNNYDSRSVIGMKFSNPRCL